MPETPTRDNPENKQEQAENQPAQSAAPEEPAFEIVQNPWPEIQIIESFDQVLSPELLENLSEASRGFSFHADPQMERKFFETGRLETGYTNKETGCIYYNPLHLKGLKIITKAKTPDEKDQIFQIKPWNRRKVMGFCCHEAGHHAPEVLEFDEKLIKDLQSPELIPDSYRGDPASEERFLGALYRHLDNALVDIWLERFMGRRPYSHVEKCIKELATDVDENGEQEKTPESKSLKSFSRPEQLMQALLRVRHEALTNFPARVLPEVFKSLKVCVESKALDVLMDRRKFENPFAAPAEKTYSIEQKFEAYKHIILPEYLKLIEIELEERKKKRQEEKEQKQSDQDQDGQSDQSNQDQQPGQGKEKPAQQGQPKPGQKGQPHGPKNLPSQPQPGDQGGRSSQPSQDAVPLTKDEQQEIIDQILSELEGAGHKAQTQAPEEKDLIEGIMDKIRRELQERAKLLGEGKLPSITPHDPLPLDPQEIMRALAEELNRKNKQRRQRGLAESMQIRQESVQRWEKIMERRDGEIDSLAEPLTEIFLDDRRKKIAFLRRQGEITPGLEHDTISAILGGEPDPATRMEVIKNPEFLETEIWFIQDTSGSMSGTPLDESIDMQVIVTEAFKRIRKALAAENLLVPNTEEPFRIASTKYHVKPEQITPLEEPLSDKKQLIMIDRASRVGGGTDEVDTVKQVYKKMTLHKKNVIKIIVLLTDGMGNQAGIAPIMRQIEEDDQIIFLAISLGNPYNKGDASAITESYLRPLRKKRGDSNIYGITANNPKQAIPQTIEFLKEQVSKKRQFF